MKVDMTVYCRDVHIYKFGLVGSFGVKRGLRWTISKGKGLRLTVQWHENG